MNARNRTGPTHGQARLVTPPRPRALEVGERSSHRRLSRRRSWKLGGGATGAPEAKAGSGLVRGSSSHARDRAPSLSPSPLRGAGPSSAQPRGPSPATPRPALGPSPDSPPPLDAFSNTTNTLWDVEVGCLTGLGTPVGWPDFSCFPARVLPQSRRPPWAPVFRSLARFHLPTAAHLLCRAAHPGLAIRRPLKAPRPSRRLCSAEG